MRSWVIAALGAAAGCTFGGSDMTEERFCQEYAHRECEKVATFCSFTAASCEPVRETACRERAAQSKTASRMFNAANVDACFAALTAAYQALPVTAAKLKTVDDACGRVFQGVTKAGESCTNDFDCAGKLVCDKGRCGTASVVGSGGGCANIGESCPKGEYCSMATGIYLCTPKQKRSMTCSQTQPCAEGLRCRDTCDLQYDIGMNCAVDDDCQSLYCNPAPAGTVRTCGPGLTFSAGAYSCTPYMSNAPSRGNTVDSGAGE
jgi:hypothetical protein